MEEESQFEYLDHEANFFNFQLAMSKSQKKKSRQNVNLDALTQPGPNLVRI